ncbi:MAG TPA: hypothetical protein VNW92_24435 [Polyangiaceae bacterium]|jgi:voltage-gated potassium channel Kch|nr:hypothetical protein [Polyangiaceae bacterium]
MLSAPQSLGSATWQTLPPATDHPNQLSDTCALLALMVRSQCASQAGSKTDVELDFKKMQELKQQLADAIQKAKEASEHSGFFGFLGKVFGSDIAQIAGAVAGVAAIVATGGAAAPLILMAVSFALEEGAQVGAKLGLDPKICAAIGIAGAALAICTGAGTAHAASTLATVGRDVELSANIVGGAATGTGAVLGGVSEHYHSKQLGFQADATGYQAQNEATNMDFDSAIALLQQSLQTEQRETSTISAIVQNNSQANSALSNRI